ncbi:MAG: DUF6390 family protein [Nocardioidaceae bacterium]
MSAEGARRFAQYAYPPNELGYCGPPGARALLDGAATDDIATRARGFEGAWSYFEVLAESAGISDPLDVAVVDAYWVGSELLEEVDPAHLVRRLEERFRGQVGGSWRGAVTRAAAHHSFQVFEVYPWAAMLRSGRPPGPAVSVLDRCRIRVGVVVAVDGEEVDVVCRRLVWDGGVLAETKPAAERARWSAGGSSLIEAPEVGDPVTLHWDWVCQVVSPERAHHVTDRESRTRELAGLSPAGPRALGRRTPGPHAGWCR